MQLTHIDAFATASEMLTTLQKGALSATTLLEMHLERIARYNPELKAIAVLNEEQARQQALYADTIRAKGEVLGPLHGLPITVKDSLEVSGLPTTIGVPERANAIAAQHGPVAQRLFEAGAVLIGKT